MADLNDWVWSLIATRLIARAVSASTSAFTGSGQSAVGPGPANLQPAQLQTLPLQRYPFRKAKYAARWGRKCNLVRRLEQAERCWLAPLNLVQKREDVTDRYLSIHRMAPLVGGTYKSASGFLLGAREGGLPR